MALPSPVADFPDFEGLVQQNQARSQSLINSAWMSLQQNAAQLKMKGDQERAAVAAAQQAAAPLTGPLTGPSNPAGSSGGYSDGLRAWGSPNPAAGGPDGPMAAFLPLLDRHEGGGRYDTLFGHSQNSGGRFAGVDVSKMTIGQLRDFASPSGEYGQWVKGQVGRVATPMGRHQIVGTTLFDTAGAMGLSDDTVFSKDVQDQIAARLASQALSRSGNMPDKIRNLRGVWEGFRSVDAGTLASAIQQFETSR